MFLKELSPTVTVAIPTYNGEPFIAAAIDSVLAQTFDDFELLVVDDGSTDSTGAIVQGYADARVRYLRNPVNLGPQGNWNACLRHARGTYFKLLPHDDLLRSDCLQRQVSVLEADVPQAIALVFSAREVVGPDGRVLTRRGYPAGKEGPIDAQSVMRACALRGTNLLGEPGAVLFRKALADTVGRFDATNPYVIDLDFWFRLLAHGDAYFCSEPLASFRVSSASWSVEIGKAQDHEFNDFIARVSPSMSPPLSRSERTRSKLAAMRHKLLRMGFYLVYLR